MSTPDNQRTYDSAFAVDHFAHLAGLQPPERSGLASFRHELAGARMLDLGVGGGRTTPHFAPLVRDYVAADYSLAMLAAPGRNRAGAKRLTADARALPFCAGTFHFVLFSYNGIDYIDHDDRLRALSEIRRVTAAGGLFFFSTHNLRYTTELLSRSFSLDPRVLVRRWRARRDNPPARELLQRRWALIRDGAMRDGLVTYYVELEEQRLQLRQSGFATMAMYALDGTPAKPDNADPWVYFLCRAE